MIGHDVRMDDFSTVQSGAILGGFVQVNKRGYIGMGAKLLPGMTVGVDSVVAAGAVVMGRVPGNTMAAGIPAIVKKTGIAGYRGK